MPHKLLWTAPRDAQLRRLRGEGASWDQIATALAISRNAAIERGRRLGARLPPRQTVIANEMAYLQDPRREPLPPGHPVTWGAIAPAESLYAHPDSTRGETARPTPLLAMPVTESRRMAGHFERNKS